MNKIIVLGVCFFLAISFSVNAEDLKGNEKASAETASVELPPAIRDLMQKEMEKLPPVERHFRMAQDYHAKGKLDDAINEINLALKEDPKHVPSNCELGIIYMGQGNYDKSIEQLNKTLELDPNYPKTHYALANAYARKPNPDIKLAREQLDEAVKLGYHAVPWFLDYMKNLEAQAAKGGELPKVQENVITETPMRQ